MTYKSKDCTQVQPYIIIELICYPFISGKSPRSHYSHIGSSDLPRRELQEETGLETAYMEQFGCFSDVNRDPRERVITIDFYALVRKSEVKGGDDAADAHWFPIDNIPALAFDHDRILRVAVQTLKERIHFKPIGFELLPEVFTMPQLQELYQSILEVKFDRRNFSNKMLKLGILTEVGERPKDAGSRIPIKYSFNLESYTKLKKEGFRLEF